MEKRRPIQKLSPQVIGQIAAGEVVERPASAVKELVENSIDAGATAITVELKEGGVSYLRVSDNGCGIPSGQIRMAFERHATSKIASAQELFDIHTLGFRGEALASIAAVSKVTLTTRTAAEDFGVRAQVEAGEVLDVREAATPVGTTILVQDLFYNTPVRLKFLKKPAMEASQVSDYMMRLILSKPHISFRFVNQGKTVYQSVGDGSPESALYCVFGKDAMRQMRRVHGVMNGLILDGFVGVGELSRGNRQLQSFFVNGRYFRDAALSKALENACQGWVMIGKFPCCALYLQLPYEQVDVNVHPNKLEVRFQNLSGIAGAVEEIVKEGLGSQSLEDRLKGTEQALVQAPQEEGFSLVSLGVGGDPQPEAPRKPEAQEPAASPIEGIAVEEKPEAEAIQEQLSKLDPAILPPAKSLEERALRQSLAPASIARVMVAPYGLNPATPLTPSIPPLQSPPAPPAQSVASAPEAPVQERLVEEETRQPLRLIGIAFQTYWLFEAGERLLWVDQHAAHERILYDKLWKQYQGEHISQRLLAPQLVQLTAQECAMVMEWKPVLEEAGFAVEEFDETSVAVHAVPTIFGKNESPRELLVEALDECQAQRGQVTRERMRKQVMQMACKKAIKAGDRLSDAEVTHLLEQMLLTGMMPTCPHGRPVVTEITRRDLEKRFKRIQ